ncbi:MAG: hypothetical protein IKL84_04510 [Clostridia bacterium]|nr:hypothetical protein [Clostridia bacterium]
MNETVRNVDDFFAKTFRIIGKSLKFIFYALVITVNAILLFRVFTMGDPAVMEKLLVNDRTAALWAEKGETMEVLTQRQYFLSEDGRFSQTNLRILPEIDQIQLTVRYNNSTLKALVEDEDIALETAPDRDEDVFDMTLVKVLPMSDAEKEAIEDEILNSDALGDDEEYEAPRKEVRYTVSDSLTAKKLMYNYRRLIFDDVDLSDAEELWIEFYYRGALDYTAEPWCSILVWSAQDLNEPYELTKDDLRALEEGIAG